MMTTSCIIRPFTNHDRRGSYRKRQSLGRSAACEEKHQLLARRPLKRSSRIVIRVGFRWFKLYERAANICHSLSQSTTTRMNRVRQAFEPTIRRAFHLYCRWAKGVTLGVRGLVIDKDQRIFLVTHTYAPGWQLPGGGVEHGKTRALARELVEEGNIETLEPPVLHGYHSVTTLRYLLCAPSPTIF